MNERPLEVVVQERLIDPTPVARPKMMVSSERPLTMDDCIKYVLSSRGRALTMLLAIENHVETKRWNEHAWRNVTRFFPHAVARARNSVEMKERARQWPRSPH